MMFPTTLQNIPEVTRLLHKAKSQNKKALVYFDPDVDGLIAGLFICRLLQEEGISFDTYINPKRRHGFFLKGIKNTLIIAADFTIEPEQIETLVEDGNIVISLDHHEINWAYEEPSDFVWEDAVIINNQAIWEDPKMRFQSGAGVTWEAFQKLKPDLFYNKTDIALVGITLLSDIREIESPEARSFLEVTYTHPYSGYFKYLIDETRPDPDYDFGVPQMDRQYIDFRFSPKINALLRFDKEFYAVKFILGGGYPKDYNYQKEQRQLVNDISETAKVKEFENLAVIETSGHLNSNFVGLIASRNTDTGKSAICYSVNPKNPSEVLRASFRGENGLVGAREALEGILDARGHSVAFGILDKSFPEGIWEKVDEILGGLKENSGPPNINVRKVGNLHSFKNSGRGYSIPYENSFKMANNRTYLEYTGGNISKGRGGPNYQVWKIDGVEVMSFDLSLTPENALISTHLSRGYSNFVLEILKETVIINYS